ncbi:hypothetical protein DCO58_06570 [Helicobacter saguini]|uniref:hypothetical protein n=1 Tax=Helicobacter saguini TaxID=1548018 RepID=UPI000AB3D2C6|nr:hypothetical protein [Helicobacter saguini]MWV67325.1 hypothetical protein [Helicobacter saguini]
MNVGIKNVVISSLIAFSALDASSFIKPDSIESSVSDYERERERERVTHAF